MHLHFATVDDARRIAEIHVVAWQKAYVGIVPADFLATLSVETREAYWRQEIPLGKQQVVLAKSGGTTVGWVSYGPSRDEDALPRAAEIWAIYVDPEHWSTGVGRQLWLYARQQLAQKGYQSVSLWVLATNARAIDFYRKASFQAEPSSTKEFVLGGATLTEIRYSTTLKITALAESFLAKNANSPRK